MCQSGLMPPLGSQRQIGETTLKCPLPPGSGRPPGLGSAPPALKRRGNEERKKDSWNER